MTVRGEARKARHGSRLVARYSQPALGGGVGQIRSTSPLLHKNSLGQNLTRYPSLNPDVHAHYSHVKIYKIVGLIFLCQQTNNKKIWLNWCVHSSSQIKKTNWTGILMTTVMGIFYLHRWYRQQYRTTTQHKHRHETPDVLQFFKSFLKLVPSCLLGTGTCLFLRWILFLTYFPPLSPVIL